jgi:S-adenosyl methyltransferase
VNHSHAGPAAFDAPHTRGPGVAHPARVYNVWIGGKDYRAADRKAADEVARCRPQVVAGARANRAFLARVVRYLTAQRGIRQFLDIGPGLPAPGNSHEVAQAIDPRCRVVYADNDPAVVAHAREVLASAPEGACGCLLADVRDPGLILGEAARTLDLTRPAALLLVAVLHFIPDSDDPVGILAALAGGLAAGSFVAVSHLTADVAPGQVLPGVAAYNGLVPVGIIPRTHAQVTGLFGGLPLVAPGVVPVAEWRPAAGGQSELSADVYAGLAAVTRRGRVHLPAPGAGQCAEVA